jgi:hypothetical protein
MEVLPAKKDAHSERRSCILIVNQDIENMSTQATYISKPSIGIHISSVQSQPPSFCLTTASIVVSCIGPCPISISPRGRTLTCLY